MNQIFDRILSRLKRVRPAGHNQFTASCPCTANHKHGDKNPSFSIGLGQKGIVYHCHSGCSQDDLTHAVCDLADCQPKDLFDSDSSPVRYQKSNGDHFDKENFVAEYIYRDEKGQPLFRKTRYLPKTFLLWRFDNVANWISGLEGTRNVPYRLPELLEAIASDQQVYVVEGEKDCDALSRHGFTATTNRDGASKAKDKPKWPREFNPLFKDAHVIVIADKDEAGYAHGIDVATQLSTTARSVRFLQFPQKGVKDAFDFFNNGASPQDLLQITADLPPFDHTNPPEETIDDDYPDFITAKDLCESDIEPPPLIIEDILHEGLKMILGGPSKAHKTWVFINLAVSVATGADFWGFPTNQGKVLLVNFEIPAAFTKQRVKKVCKELNLDYPTDLVLWNLRGEDTPANTFIRKLINRCKYQNFKTVIIDPSYKMADHDYDENAAGSVQNLLREIDKIPHQLGAAVITGAHYAKGNAASKETIDRISGSGVFARDTDVFFVLTPHKVDNCFIVSVILRNLPPIKDFVVEWAYPLMAPRPDLDPSDIKQPERRRPAPAKKDPKPAPEPKQPKIPKTELDLLELVSDPYVNKRDLLRVISPRNGIPVSISGALLDRLIQQQKVWEIKVKLKNTGSPQIGITKIQPEPLSDARTPNDSEPIL